MRAKALESEPNSNYCYATFAGGSGGFHSHRPAVRRLAGAGTGGCRRLPEENQGAPEPEMASLGYKGVLKRPGYAYLLAAQALAVFDDNTFKQLLVFFIIGQGFEISRRNWLISL